MDPLYQIYVKDITENLLSITRLFADELYLAGTSLDIYDLDGISNYESNEISK